MLRNCDIEKLEQHWAVASIPSELRINCQREIEKSIVQHSVGEQIKFDFDFDKQIEKAIPQITCAYEIAAIENINGFINPNDTDSDRSLFVAAAWKTFEFYRSMKLPDDNIRKIFFVLHLSSMAYCGERWNDLWRWYTENHSHIKFSIDTNSLDWDKHLLYSLYSCWIHLFTKKDWDDLNSIQSSICDLRQKQKEYEEQYLKLQETEIKSSALRLVSLYHWAKSTELLSIYVTQGEPVNITTQLDKHFESAIESAALGGDSEFELLLKWLHCAARQMVEGSIWWIARTINSRTTDFVKHVTRARSLFEMLPPQKAAIREQGLLDQASTAIVVEMPTSGGKTLLAEFKILQALNQFDANKGWVAYAAPTKALVSQVTRRLRKDFSSNIKVSQLSAAVEIDTFENDLLTDNDRSFDVLVATPEKLNLVIRNNKIPRPLALLVMDEAHNIEDSQRGLRIELLLATVKSDCPTTNFLLLMPYVENSNALASWLSNDISSGKSISIGSTPWQPNERIVGLFKKEVIKGSVRANWGIKYKTLITTPKTISFSGEYSVSGEKFFGIAQSSVTKKILTAAIAKTMSSKGTSLAIGRTTDDSWGMAREICKSLEVLDPIPDEILLVQRFLKTEISSDFELIDMLSKGVGVHNAGLSDETRELMEWLTEEGILRVLCATMTVAQGLNFPVSSVFIQSISLPSNDFSRDMSPREFWNLAGRAGRIGHNSVGVVGLACDGDEDKIAAFVSDRIGNLISRLVSMINELDEAGRLFELNSVIFKDEWIDFRCYITHLCNEKDTIDAVLSDTEQLLRNTFGYNVLKASKNGDVKAKALLDVTKEYAARIKKYPRHIVEMADQTGFSPEGIFETIKGIRNLDTELSVSKLSSVSIFGNNGELADLYGLMMKLPQLKQLSEIAGIGFEHKKIAAITTDWVSGKTIKEIALKHFTGDSNTERITDACKAINRQIVNCGTWGLSVITKMSGIDFDKLSEAQKREINSLPAMIYHGVNTSEAVLMRMNNVPRSISHKLGVNYARTAKTYNVQEARDFIKSMSDDDWEGIRNKDLPLTGKDYKEIWKRLSGE